MNTTKDEAIKFLNRNKHFTKVDDQVSKIPKYICDIKFNSSNTTTLFNDINNTMHEIFPGDWTFIYSGKTQLTSKLSNTSILKDYNYLEEMEVNGDFIDIYFKLNK